MDQPAPAFWDDLRHPHPQHPAKGDSLRDAGPTSTSSSRAGTPGPGRLAIAEDQSIFHFCEGNLNFSTAHSEDDDYFHKKKISRDPMSHRIIEKRRRDRMNNCLADLSRLIPAEYLKKGRGRVEKTEIIEMAIKHMQYLQARATLSVGVSVDCGAIPSPGTELRELRVAKCEQSPESDREQSSDPARDRDRDRDRESSTPPPGDSLIRPVVSRPIITEHYRLGYQECLSEAMHFLVEVEGYFAGDSLCVKLISHLQKHCDKIVKGDRLNFPRSRRPGEASSSSGSSSSCQGGGSKAPGTTASWPSSAEEVGPGSQLREILCSSPPGPCTTELPQHQHPHHAYLSPRAHALPHTPPHPHPQQPSAQQQQQPHFEDAHHMDSVRQSASHHHHHHHMDVSQEHHHSYKFKNNIKQRFSEEHGNTGHPHPLQLSHTPPPPPAHGLKRRRPATTRSRSRSPSPVPSQPTSSQHAGVPIFVLHARGSFYIPLTVSCEVLAPYMDSDLLSDVSTNGPTSASSVAPSNVVLHPVTISVNFQQYLKAAPTQSSTPAPTHHAPLPLPLPLPIPLQHPWPRSDGFHISWDQ